MENMLDVQDLNRNRQVGTVPKYLDRLVSLLLIVLQVLVILGLAGIVCRLGVICFQTGWNLISL